MKLRPSVILSKRQGVAAKTLNLYIALTLDCRNISGPAPLNPQPDSVQPFQADPPLSACQEVFRRFPEGLGET